MQEKQKLAQEISAITKLDSLSFEKELNHHLTNAHLLPILADLLASSFQHQQKILAASAINRTIIHRLDLDYKRWPLIWQQFHKEVLSHPQLDKMEWRHFQLLSRGLKQLMDDMVQNLCTTLNSVFQRSHIKVKVLIYQSFAETQTTKETRYVFLRQTIECYVEQIFNFVCWCHQSQPSKDSLKLQHSILANLSVLLNNLEVYLNDTLINELLVKISLNDGLFQLVIEELLFAASKDRYESVKKKEFSKQRIGELSVFVAGDTDTARHLNEVKAYTMTIFTVLLRQYDKKSELQDFDRYKHLNLMQNLAPIILQKITEMVTKHQITEDSQFTIISLLQFLNLAAKFNFLLQFFDSNLEKILFQVCFPLLAADQLQSEEFNDNNENFITIAEEAIEMPDNYTKTLKNAASNFLQRIADTLDGSLVFIVETNISIIKYVLTDQIQSQLLKIIEKFQYSLSIQASIHILTLFSEVYLRRDDLLELLKHRFLQLAELVNLEKMELARLFIFLAYNYETIYAKQEERGTKFVILASNHLESQTAVSQSALMLFQNCIKLGFGEQIWDNLLLKLQSTQTIGIFKIFKRIVTKMLQNLASDYVKNLINKLIDRFISEFKNANKDQNTIKSNIFMSQILNILQQISESRNYLRNEPTVIDALWPIFDLFEYVDRIEFQDNLLRIFNCVLAASKTIDRRYFKFMDHLPQIHLRNKGFSLELLSTYSKLLDRGRQHFLNDEQRPSSLQNLIQSLKSCYSMLKKQQSLLHFCIFFHFIFIEYSSLLKKDQEFFQILHRYYIQYRQLWSKQTLAAVLNLFVIAEVEFGGIDLTIIQENSIQIFQGYQAQMFALGLRKLIEKDHRSEIIVTYLRYSMRLLHYIRELNLADHPPKQNYYTPHFQTLKTIDPFMQICGSLDFLKRTLEAHRYDSLLQQLRSEISVGEIKDLLSRRIVDKSLRTIYKVRPE